MTQRALDLTFPKFKLYKPKPHHPNWNQLHREALALSLKICNNTLLKKNPLSRSLFQKRKLLALFKTLKALFINMRRIAKRNENFIPLFYIWTMTNACNFRCGYCSNHRGAKYPDLWEEGLKQDLNTEQGKNLIRIMKGSTAIYFCGGEPTLRKDLPELLDYSTKLNMFNMINTNGSLIGDLLLKTRYRNFLSQMDVIIISLDSLSIPQLAEIYKTDQNIARKILRNILSLRILQNFIHFKLVANTVITRDTIEESFDILDWCNDLGICFSPISANLGHEPDYDLIQNPRYQALVTKILERANQGYLMIASTKMLKRVLLAKELKCYPTVFDHIDYTGELFWPCKAYQDASMINVLHYKNVDAVHKAAEKIFSPTKFHGDGIKQCQGHCAWMQNCVTDAYARALIEGIIDSGIFNEIRGLMA
ncbi:MAG TPA: radical SAM protein [Candidatus Deferrimicrobium sp.]|nr:radical SAM protein [Candidatus Deferrimicrobium sp.]